MCTVQMLSQERLRVALYFERSQRLNTPCRARSAHVVRELHVVSGWGDNVCTARKSKTVRLRNISLFWVLEWSGLLDTVRRLLDDQDKYIDIRLVSFRCGVAGTV